MSIATKIRAHKLHMDRVLDKLDYAVEKLDHDTSKYRSLTSSEERANQCVLGLKEVVDHLSPVQRKRLLSLTNQEMTDCSFRRFLQLALQS